MLGYPGQSKSREAVNENDFSMLNAGHKHCWTIASLWLDEGRAGKKYIPTQQC